MTTANHFRFQYNFRIGASEMGQCGFYFMASDTTLPVPFNINQPLPERTLDTGFWSASNPTGAMVTGFDTAAGTSLTVAEQLAMHNYARLQWDLAYRPLSDSQVKLISQSIIPLDQSRQAVAQPSVYTLYTPLAGNANAQSAHPWFMSLALGWRSAGSGRSQRGRMYLPATSAPLTATTREISSLTLTALCDETQAMFESFNNTYSCRPVIVHRTVQLLPPSVVYNTYSDVASLRVNNRLDTMKTRGNSYPNVYTDVPLTYA